MFSNKNQIESDHVKIEALSDKKELKKLVMKRQESRQQLNQSLHATPTHIPGATPTYIPCATPSASTPIKVHRFQEKKMIGHREKCVQCQNKIRIAKTFLKCKDCGLACHLECDINVADPCPAQN